MCSFNKFLLLYFLSLNVLFGNNNLSLVPIIKDGKYDSIYNSLEKNKIYVQDPIGSKKKAQLLVKLSETNLQKIKSLKILGSIYQLTGNTDSSIYCFQKKLEIVKKDYLYTTDYYQAVIDYVNSASDTMESSDLVKMLTEAMSKIDEKKNGRELGIMCSLLGDIFMKNKDFKKAEHYYDKSSKLLTDTDSYFNYYTRKAYMNISRNQFSKAKTDFESAIKIVNDNSSYKYAFILYNLGYTNYRLKNFDLAKKNLIESLALQKKYNFNNLNSSTYVYLSLVEKVAQNYVAEKKYLDAAKSLSENDLNSLKSIYMGYCDYYSRMHDIDNEQIYSDLYTMVDDSINNIETQKVKLKLESIYQLKENRKKLALQQSVIEKESKLKTFYLLSAFVLFIFSILIYWVWRKKFNAQKQLNENQISLHEQSLKLMQENQRTEIIKEKIKAKIEERGKLSLELHDGIANEIASLKLSISEEENLDQEKIKFVVNKIDKIYNEVRDLSHELDPDNIADVEFSQLVNNLCSLTEKNGLKTEKNILISKNIDELDENILVNIYRIIQEAINNTIKHAYATELKIDIIESEDELYLAIKDNGKGFSVSSSKPGIGLKNIQKRVNSLSGICDISNSSFGTTVAVRIPKNQLQIKVA